jgi:hypothetical protein
MEKRISTPSSPSGAAAASPVGSDGVRRRDSHIFARQDVDHYVEPEWVSERLFDEEEFDGPILDPCCGWGRILQAARTAGYKTKGSDVVQRKGCRHENFVAMQANDRANRWWAQAGALICNPPFELMREFCFKACSLMRQKGSRITKVAMIFPVRRLPAAIWLEEELPLYKVLFLTPRPSMPTAEYIQAGGKVGGGTQDYCWVIFKRGFTRKPTIGWLHRDGAKLK